MNIPTKLGYNWPGGVSLHFNEMMMIPTLYNKGNNKITELRTILQRESKNS
jgi:hypothetical protein